MTLNYKRVLVISPHTDDAEVSSGGTISRLLREGSEVHVLVLSRAYAEDAHRPTDECKAALATLGVSNAVMHDFPVRRFLEHRQEILDIFVEARKLDPDLVLLPSVNDIHQDHQVVAREGLRAFKDRSIFGYEYPWNHLVFNTTCFVKLTEEDMARKIAAIHHYQSQQKDYLQPELIRAWALTRGVAVGTRYAESFEVMRLVA